MLLLFFDNIKSKVGCTYQFQEEIIMDENTRRECTPQEYIRKLFEETKDGKLTIHYFPIFDQSYSSTYQMDWSHKDAESMVARYDALTSALTHIAELHDELQDTASRQKLLTTEEFEIWDTYIRPFEPFEVDLDIITDLHFRLETDSLDDDENELLERYHKWFVANAQQRLPFDRYCPAKMVNRAQRYEKLMSINAPEVVAAEEGRFLAEEMVLYYHSVRKIEYDMLRFILAQSSTYSKALEEIKNGQKCTHWMWFIFPQLRGLGLSEMANTYGISDLDEAKTYLSHTTLGTRLIEISTALLELDENDPEVIFGDIDAMKLKSSMTLFALISDDDSVFHKVLQKFFEGQTDSRTLEILGSQDLNKK